MVKMRRGGSKSLEEQQELRKRPPVKKKNDFVVSLANFRIVGKVGAVILTIASILWIFATFREHGTETNLPRAITPLPSPKIMDLSQFQGEHKERLFWGTYRPHIYLGIRSRSPKSLLFGLMWLGVKDGKYALRHTCEDNDGLKRYGWLRHDGYSYGRQEILDQNVKLTTSFVKSFDEGHGYGGDWSVRINVDNYSDDNKFASLFFYVADEDDSSLNLWSENIGSGPFVSGHKQDIGNWEMHFNGQKGARVNYAGFRTQHMHNLTDLVRGSLIMKDGGVYLQDESERSSNIAVFQITGETPFQLDVTFVGGVNPQESSERRAERLSGTPLDDMLATREGLFEERFQNSFRLKHDELSGLGTNALEVGKAALSNLLGGISYFYGESQVTIPPNERPYYDDDHWNYWPGALFSAVPCRSFFPRGFLWDEGFHQIVVSKWDRNLTYDIVGHWLDMLNIDGWIPREQILGAEARSRVPDEFIKQRTDHGNPPTLFLPMHEIALAALEAEASGHRINIEKAFLEKTFPRLEAWFNWFNTTQIGKSPGTYYWHGRDPDTVREINAKSFSSGLDDYPRASHPTEDERHVDLRCWMALAANSMVLIAKVIGVSHEKYEATAQLLSDFNTLNELHYDSARGRYYDYGNHTEKVKLEPHTFPNHRTGYYETELRRVVFGRPQLKFVPHFGYVNLFPFIMKLIPADSPVLLKQLELIHSDKLLWSNYGLRSLSKTSSLYNKHNTQHDPPYWRGSVWINFNYLVLASLKHYAEEAGPYQDTAASMYKELRENLISNIVRRYDETGYLFEQYDNNKEGAGKGARPFTGWTSLVVLIMAEQYPH